MSQQLNDQDRAREEHRLTYVNALAGAGIDAELADEVYDRIHHNGRLCGRLEAMETVRMCGGYVPAWSALHALEQAELVVAEVEAG